MRYLIEEIDYRFQIAKITQKFTRKANSVYFVISKNNLSLASSNCIATNYFESITYSRYRSVSIYQTS